MIIRLQHVGLSLKNLHEFSEKFERLFVLKTQDFRDNQSKDLTQLDARIMFPNHCWIHAVQNWNPESRVYKFLNTHGEGLEHISLETDNIEKDIAHVRELNIPVYQDKIFNAPDGYEAFIYPNDAIGFTIELIQPHESSWKFDAAKINPNVLGLQHIGLAVKNVDIAGKYFERVFGLKSTNLRTDQHGGQQRDLTIELGNDRLWLHVVEPLVPEHRVFQHLVKYGEGLEHLGIEVADICKAVMHVQSAGVPLEQNKIYLDRPDGFEAFVLPQYNSGITVELIEPYPMSRGYRF